MGGGVRAATGCPTRGYRALIGRLLRADSTIGGHVHDPPEDRASVARRSPPARAPGRPRRAARRGGRARRGRRQPQRGGFLGRLFPPAPPLPNKPPPLAGFDESGPLRPIRVRAFLLRRNLAAWVATGLVAAVGYYASVRLGPADPLSLVGTFVLFGALIAAGWFGWQRPALYGTAAAILSFALSRSSSSSRPRCWASRRTRSASRARSPARSCPGRLPGRPRLPRRLVRRLPASPPDAAERRSRAARLAGADRAGATPRDMTIGTRLARVGT